MKVWIKDSTGFKSPIELHSTPLAGGGEGDLYEIISPDGYEKLLAKIYHPSKRTELRYNKLLYLHENPPLDSMGDIPPSLVWPKSLLFDENDNFLGFVMSKVTGEKLEILCLPKISQKLQTTWGTYDFLADTGLKKRLGVAYNLAHAVHLIHKTEHYILIDVKPDNVMLTPEGALYLVDLDSVEVVEQGETVYDAAVATPEYTPPDSYLKNWEIDPTQEEAWDRFGLAVIIYKLLLGVHPYAATGIGPYAAYTDLSEKIEHGLFVHNPIVQDNLSAIPDLHQQFHQLPLAIRKLFERCFIDGHHDPFLRPSSKEWMLVLTEFDPKTSIKEEGLKIPPVLLEQVPQNINLDSFFDLPSTFLVSQIPKLQLEKPLDKKALREHILPTSIQDPKQIRSQRFFNFMTLLLIVVIATAFSLAMPWQVTLVFGLAAYFGFNWGTYKIRKSADKKELIMGVLETQMSNFKNLVKVAEDYEKTMMTYIDNIKTAQLKKPKEYLEKIFENRLLIQSKINDFKKYILTEKEKIKLAKKEERTDLKNLHQYYIDQAAQKAIFKNIEATTLEQKLILVKRARRLGKLSEAESQNFDTNLGILEQLNIQLEIEETDLRNKALERFKNSLFRCEEAYNELSEEINYYNQSVQANEEDEIISLIKEKNDYNQKIERLKFDLLQLEEPLDNQVKSCRKAQRDAELYKKINYPRHLLEMVGLAKPF